MYRKKEIRKIILIFIIILLLFNLVMFPFENIYLNRELEEKQSMFGGNNNNIICFSDLPRGSSPIFDVTLPNDSGADKFPNLAIYDNKLYIAWSSMDRDITSPTALNESDYDIVIRSFDGRNWSEIVELSPQAIETKSNTGEAEGQEDDYYPNIIAYKNKLYVFWVHNILYEDEPSIIQMRYYNGVQWSNVINFSYGGRGDGIIYNNKLYYAYTGGEEYHNYSFLIRAFDGTSWAEPEIIDSTECGIPNLEINKKDNSLYVCWGNIENISMKRFNGKDWDDKIVVDEQGQNYWDDESYYGPEICFFNNSGNIIWSDLNSIKYKSFNGTDLSKIILLNVTPYDKTKYNPKLIEFRNKLYAGWDRGKGFPRQILLRSLDGNTWDEVKRISPDTNSRNSHLQLIEYNDVLYLAWQTNDPTISNGKDLDIVLRPIFGSSLKCNDNAETINPGESVTYNITINNYAVPKSKYDNNLKLELGEIPNDWTAKLNRTEINLDISESINLTLRVIAPNNVYHDQWANITINCRQKDLSIIEDSITISTFMEVEFGINLSCKNNIQYIGPNESVYYNILVKNNGNINDTINLSLSPVPSLWSAKLNITSISLPPFSNNTVQLNVTAPKSIKQGEKVTIKIFGTSQRYLNNKYYVIITTIANLIYKINLFCYDPEHHAKPGEITNYIIQVKNKGNDIDTIFLSISKFKWNTSINPDNITLNPFESQNIVLTIKVPDTVIADTKDTGIITGRSFKGNITNILQIITIIDQIHDFSAIIEPNYIKTVPNSSLNFDLNISNKGNGYEIINLTLNHLPIDWNIDFDQEINNNSEIYLNPFEKRNIRFLLNIPFDTQPGKYEIILNLTTKLINKTIKILIEILQDSDNDGVPDDYDSFPNDPRYSKDSDLDNIPDIWEDRYSLNPFNSSDGDQDLDSDGFTNLEEYNANKDPSNQSDYPDKEKQDDENRKNDKDKGFFVKYYTYLIYFVIIIIIITFLIILAITKKLKLRNDKIILINKRDK